MPSTCRFPPPWSIEESFGCFIVRDGDKQALARVNYEIEPGRRSISSQPGRLNRGVRCLMQRMSKDVTIGRERAEGRRGILVTPAN